MREKDKWDQIAADFPVTLPPPEGPSLEDLAAFSRALSILNTNQFTSIVILGCTTGLRQLLAKEAGFSECEVICVDFSERMYERTQEGTPVGPNEQFLCADWLDFDLTDRAVGAVLADQALNQIPRHRWPRFFGNIGRHLDAGGIFVQRIHVVDETLRDKTFTNLLSKWANRYVPGGTTWNSIIQGIWQDCLSASVFCRNQDPPVQRVGKLLDEIHQCNEHLQGAKTISGRIIDSLLTRYSEESFNQERPAIIFSDFNCAFEEEFKIMDIKYAADYEARAHPVITSRQFQ